MGSYLVACALTRTAIGRGGEVMLVHTRTNAFTKPYPEHRAHTHALLQAYWQQDEQARELAEQEASLTGQPEMSAWLQHRKQAHAQRQLGYVAVLGTYDEYGWITLPGGNTYRSGQPTERDLSQPEYKNHGDERLPERHCFFVKTRVLSELFLDRQPVTETNKDAVLRALAVFAGSTRIQLFGDTHSLTGENYPDESEYQRQRKLLAVTEHELDLLEQRLEETQ